MVEPGVLLVDYPVVRPPAGNGFLEEAELFILHRVAVQLQQKTMLFLVERLAISHLFLGHVRTGRPRARRLLFFTDRRHHPVSALVISALIVSLAVMGALIPGKSARQLAKKGFCQNDLGGGGDDPRRHQL